MPSFMINDREREALRGLQLLAVSVYTYGLRPFMDYGTGVVGISRGVSWLSIAEESEVWPERGIPRSKANKNQIKRSVEWLVKRGLLRWDKLGNEASGRLIFKCILATIAEPRLNISHPIPDPPPTPLSRPINEQEKQFKNNDNDKENFHTRPAKLFVPPPIPDPPLVTGTGKNKTALRAVVAGASPATSGELVLANNYPLPDCPHQDIIDAYHNILPTCRRVRSWGSSRQSSLRARWKEHPALSWWEEYFQHVARSAFLTGKIEPSPGRSQFVANLEWLIKPTKMANILEGNYHGAPAGAGITRNNDLGYSERDYTVGATPVDKQPDWAKPRENKK